MCEKEYLASEGDGGASQEELIAFFRRLLVTAESGERVITCITMTVPEVRTGANEFTADGSQVWEIRTEPKDGPFVFARVGG